MATMKRNVGHFLNYLHIEKLLRNLIAGTCLPPQEILCSMLFFFDI